MPIPEILLVDRQHVGDIDLLTSERGVLSLEPADRSERRNQQPQKEEEQRDHRGRRYVIPLPDQTDEVFSTHRGRTEQSYGCFGLIPITSDLARRPALALLPALPSIAERTVVRVLPIVLASVHHDGGGVSQRLK
jgi:hypothetical protein